MNKKKRELSEIFRDMKDSARITYCGKSAIPKHGDVLIVSWTLRGCGFGQYTFYQNKKGKWVLDSECMSRDSVKRILGILVDSIPLEDELRKKKSTCNHKERKGR